VQATVTVSVPDDMDQDAFQALSGVISEGIEEYFPVTVTEMAVSATDITPSTATDADSAHNTGLGLTALMSILLFADVGRA